MAVRQRRAQTFGNSIAPPMPDGWSSASPWSCFAALRYGHCDGCSLPNLPNDLLTRSMFAYLLGQFRIVTVRQPPTTADCEARDPHVDELSVYASEFAWDAVLNSVPLPPAPTGLSNR